MAALIRNLEPNWQLPGKTSSCNEDFGSSMPSLSLTLNGYKKTLTINDIRVNLIKVRDCNHTGYFKSCSPVAQSAEQVAVNH